LLHDPAAAIRQIQQTGFFAGDCDDIALVAAALGLAVGLEARYVLIALRPSDPWHHILTELRGGSREPWIAIDPSRPVGGAYLPARTVAIPI
jgi:transglutaminase-like putative cysteine protease